MATQTKKAGRRIWEKRPFVFLLAQWNLLTMRPWNWLSFNHQPSKLKLPCPSSTSGSGDEGLSALPGGEGDIRRKRQNWLTMRQIIVTVHVCQSGWFCRLDNAHFAVYILVITIGSLPFIYLGYQSENKISFTTDTWGGKNGGLKLNVDWTSTTSKLKSPIPLIVTVWTYCKMFALTCWMPPVCE